MMSISIKHKYKHQYAFIDNRSTDLAIIELTYRITKGD